MDILRLAGFLLGSAEVSTARTVFRMNRSELVTMWLGSDRSTPSDDSCSLFSVSGNKLGEIPSDYFGSGKNCEHVKHTLGMWLNYLQGVTAYLDLLAPSSSRSPEEIASFAQLAHIALSSTWKNEVMPATWSGYFSSRKAQGMTYVDLSDDAGALYSDMIGSSGFLVDSSSKSIVAAAASGSDSGMFNVMAGSPMSHVMAIPEDFVAIAGTSDLVDAYEKGKIFYASLDGQLKGEASTIEPTARVFEEFVDPFGPLRRYVEHFDIDPDALLLGPEFDLLGSDGNNPPDEELPYQFGPTLPAFDVLEAEVAWVHYDRKNGETTWSIRFHNTSDKDIGLSYIEDSAKLSDSSGEFLKISGQLSGVRTCLHIDQLSDCNTSDPRYATMLAAGRFAQITFKAAGIMSMREPRFSLSMDFLVTPDISKISESRLGAVGFFGIAPGDR